MSGTGDKVKRFLQSFPKFRSDGYYNETTGLGTTRDKNTATYYQQSRLLSVDSLNSLYTTNDMAARVAEVQPEEALRQGFDVTGDIDIEQGVQQVVEDLELLPKLIEAAVWGNVFGWGAVYLGADDGARNSGLARPLRMDRIRTIDHLNVLDRCLVSPVSFYNDPTKAKHGQPEIYRMVSTSQGGLRQASTHTESLVHESRLLICGGVRTTIRQRQSNGGFDVSLIQRVNDVLTQFGTSWSILESVLVDAQQGIYKLQGYADALAQGDTVEIRNRMADMDLQRSTVRAVVLDAELEDFNRQDFRFDGIDKIMELFMLRLAAAAKTPAMVLLSQSPPGLNATGEAELKWFHGQLAAYQNYRLKPLIRKFLRVLFASSEGPTGGQEPENWDVEFPSFYQPTDRERVETRKITAETDKIYLEAGVLTPQEVADSRYREDGWSDETVLDPGVERVSPAQLAAADVADQQQIEDSSSSGNDKEA